ncbi:MAG: hypothetical protein JXR97_11080 [Planctomycetes bacterium]|nr:hypothetical protein [Planctomycetota bacterium]
MNTYGLTSQPTSSATANSVSRVAMWRKSTALIAAAACVWHKSGDLAP